EEYYRAILRALPGDVWALNYLGVVLYAQGQHAQAKEMLAKAVRVSPQNIEAWINLSNVERALGDLDGCETSLKAALSRSPDAAQLVINLADVLTSKGQSEEARELLTAAAFRRPDEPALLSAWGSKFLGSLILAYDDRIDALLCRVLDLPTTWASAYARPVYRFLNRHPILMEMMARTNAGDQAQSINYESYAHILSTIQSLVKMMGLSSAVDADHEIFLTELRRVQLDQRSLVPTAGAAPIAFSVALAQFCFNNDYVFFERPEEKAQLALLQDAIESSAASGVVDWGQVVCFCSYRPLTQLGVAMQIAQAPHAELLRDLLLQQFAEPAAEIEIRATIGALRPIEDDVSR
ncbi:MAG: tetratricopeptide repeat protein, partial [Alphaproteobacteria bacterium]|nr:tetratricopeptide repeat protein [Alphaproteobacteria bacterium]